MNRYEEWMRGELLRRKNYTARSEHGLLSIITPVRDTLPEFLTALGRSILDQDFGLPGGFEWVILDNGSTRSDTLQLLAEFAKEPAVNLIRSEENLGIIAGTRLLARRACGRYIVPADHDDYLYPDAVRIVAAHVQQHGYPAFLYSDEDKLEGASFGEAYFKPDWDPVLFVHSCYTSHLGVIDRGLAILLDLYTDPATEGSPDWDAFFRLMIAGYQPVHIPEVLYSWRKHPQSTSANMSSKSYIHSSQRAVLNRFRSALKHENDYSVEPSPLFQGTPDWWFRRAHARPRPLLTIMLSEPGEQIGERPAAAAEEPQPRKIEHLPRNAGAARLIEIVAEIQNTGALVHLAGDDVIKDYPEWYWEVLAIMEMFPDTVAVGGPLYNHDGICVSAGIHFGFGDGCGMPDRLRPRRDPGYFVRLWKPHSVSALTSQNLVLDRDFLLDALLAANADIPLSAVGEYAGSAAMRWGKRIVCSPLLSASTARDWVAAAGTSRCAAFIAANQDLIPDTRFYSSHLDLRSGYAYEFAPPGARASHLRSLRTAMDPQIEERGLLSCN